MMKRLCLALLTSGCVGTGYDAVEVAPRSDLELAAFSRLQLHAWGVRSNGSREDITDLVRWFSSDDRVAMVGETGTLGWVGAGTARIRVVFYDLDAAVVLTAAEPVAVTDARQKPVTDDVTNLTGSP